MKKTLQKLSLTLILFLGLGFLLASGVSAQVPCPSPVNTSAPNLFDAGDISNKALPGTRGEPCQSGTTLAYYIAIFWETALIVAGLGFLGYLLIGGFRYLTAGGDSKMTAEARNIIIHAFVGLGIVASSYVVIRIVESVFGVTIATGPIKFPTPF